VIRHDYEKNHPHDQRNAGCGNLPAASTDQLHGGLGIRRDRMKRVAEPIVEIEHVVEILSAIGIRLFHLPDVDEIENDFAEIGRGVDPPLVEYILRQHAILLDGVLTNRLAELLAGDVPLLV
jgi:hypothetical protein